jgi:hypothetical protein
MVTSALRSGDGPNLSNVFKRTFYQIAYKFQLAGHSDCAGTGSAVPRSVWQSWIRHLGSPELVDNGDGTHCLEPAPTDANDATSDAWIFGFELDEEANHTPRPLRMWRQIGIDPRTLLHLALAHSPGVALAQGGPADGVKEKVLRVWKHWPEVVPRIPRRRARRTGADQPETLDLQPPVSLPSSRRSQEKRHVAPSLHPPRQNKLRPLTPSASDGT